MKASERLLQRRVCCGILSLEASVREGGSLLLNPVNIGRIGNYKAAGLTEIGYYKSAGLMNIAST